MKNMLSKTIAALFAFFLTQNISAQSSSSKDSFSLIGGKWAVCADTLVTENYQCTDPYTGFKFLKNGRYREYPKKPIDPAKEFLEGDWTIEGNLFTLDQDDEQNAKQFPKTYEIVWVNNNRFYASAKQGEAGPPLIVYFQRIP